MKNRTEDTRKPSPFNRHAEAWRCKFIRYSLCELTESALWGTTIHWPPYTKQYKKERALIFFLRVIPASLLHHSKYKCLWKQGISKLLLTVSSVTSQMKLASKSDMENLCTWSVLISLSGRSHLTQALPVGVFCGYNEHLKSHLLVNEKGLTPQQTFHPPQ